MVRHQAIDPPDTCWRVIPLHTPRVLRHCPKCGVLRRFASSDKFRLNAQQVKVDVWLIYKCLECDCTWNCPILERRTVKQIGSELYERFQQNDRDLAWSCAFDYALLSRLRVNVDSGVDVEVECGGTESMGPEKSIRIELTYPGVIRLDRLLGRQLKVSRTCLQEWHDSGRLRVCPEEKHALRKTARTGQIIFLMSP